MSPAITVGISAVLRLLDIAAMLYMTQNNVPKATEMQDMRRDLITGKVTREEAEARVKEIHTDAMAELDAAIDALPVPTHRDF